MNTGLKHIVQHSKLAVAAFTVAALAGSAPTLTAQVAPAKIQGKVTNMAGDPLTSGQVKFTTDIHTDYKDEKFAKVAEVDKEGNYTVADVAPGDYLVWLVQGDKTLDRVEIVIKPGEPKTIDFDLSRADYIAKMSPEQRKALEEYKAKNAEANAANKQIAGLNATLTSVRADLKSPSPNYDKDVADSKAAIQARPNESLLQILYGDALFDKSEAAAKQDHANKVNPGTDDAVKQGYSDAADAYTKALDQFNADPKKPAPEVIATVYNELGNTLSRIGKLPEATSAYDKAVTAEPKNAGLFYTNEAAVFFNAHQDEPAVAAADKAIAADPSKPLPYYIKGQELLQKATVDKTGKVVPPPGCVDAYQKYLELAPDGPMAQNVREALGALGEKVATHYTAAKKK